MHNLVQLSDSQLDQILRAAAPLAPNDRSALLADVAAALHGQALGDGAVFRIICEIQERYFRPPEFAPGRSGKYGRWMAYWTACRLQRNRAALALHILNLQGDEVYCPRLRELRVLRGRRVEVLLPLFPGYS
jgi:hypothetical protein